MKRPFITLKFHRSADGYVMIKIVWKFWLFIDMREGFQIVLIPTIFFSRVVNGGHSINLCWFNFGVRVFL